MPRQGFQPQSSGQISDSKLTPLGRSYWGGDSETPTPTPTETPVPQTRTGLSVLPSEGRGDVPRQGSLTDFSSAMRAVSKDAYKYRQEKEGKVTGKQFDPSRVSGSIFKTIMQNVEGGRGKDISKIYGGAVEAAKFDIEQREEERQAKVAQENKKFDIIKQKAELGIDSVYIPSGTLADRNNNPGNLRFVGQAGAVMGENGFAKFNNPEDGYQALINQIQLDQSRGLTLKEFVSKYAPPTENDTNLYVEQMAGWLGVDANMNLADIDVYNLAENVAKKESGTQIVSAATTGDDVSALARKYKSGELSAAQIPAAQRGEVIAAAEGLSQQVSPEQKATLMQNVSIVDKLLDQDKYKAISGLAGGPFSIPFTAGRQTANEFKQLKGLLSLDKRQMMKGSGAISDFEAKMLGEAATNINRLSSEKDFLKELIRIRGAFNTAAGNAASVQVSKDGQTKTGMLTKDEISEAVSQGFIVDYI